MGVSSGGGGFRVHELDGLRALAASLVVLHHAGTARLGTMLIEAGHIGAGRLLGSLTSSGVELFFVLSGAVLLRPYFRDNRPVRLVEYLRRRIVRLWPPFAAAWLLAGLAVYLSSTFPTWWTATADIPGFTLKSWLLQLPIVYLSGPYYNYAWWTLVFECFFYAAAPAVAVLVMRVRFTMFRTITLLYALAILAEFSSRGLLGIAVLDEFVAYLPCFACGTLLARRDYPIAALIAAAVLGCGLVGLTALGTLTNFHLGYALLYGAVIGLAQAGHLRVLGAPLLVWLGERSYSLFLTHCSVFAIVSHLCSIFLPLRGLGHLAISRAIGIPLALLVAMALFRFVECRFARNLLTADRFWPWPLRLTGPAQTPTPPRH